MTDVRPGGALDSGHIPSLATLPASSRQRWWSFGAVVSLLVAFCLVAPFGKLQLPEAIGFIPAVHGAIFVTDLTTAVWLFNQVSIHRSPALLALANAYLSTAIIVFAHTLTFPGAFAQGGLLGAGTQTTGWLYITWHFVLPVAVLAYAVLRQTLDARGRILLSARSAILWSVVCVTVGVPTMVWALVVGDKVIPPLFIDQITYSPLVPYSGALNGVVCGLAFFCLVLRRPSILDELLAISVAATVAETAITTFFSAGRYDIGWYASGGFQLVASTVVFLALFAEFTRLKSTASVALAESKRADDALRESEERLRLAVASSRMGMWDWDVRTGTYFWNDENYRLFGYEAGKIDLNRDAWAARVHPDDLKAAELAAVTAQREHRDYLSEYRVVRPDGSTRWVQAHGRFLYQDRKPIRMIGLMKDITDARQQIEAQRVLVGELQHRTRNLMAVVQSIAHQTLDTVDSLAEFEANFNHRLESLSRVQSLLSRADSEPITLRALLDMEFDALGLDAFDSKITLFGGPEVQLRKSAVEMLALAIHELLTNAVKYGAFASETGRLSVAWRIEGIPPHQHVVLEWIERGIASPATAADHERHGFGRTLIEEALPYTLSADTTFELGTNSLRCLISLPLTHSGIAGMLAA